MFIDDVIADVESNMKAQGFSDEGIKYLSIANNLKLSHAFCLSDESESARQILAETSKTESAIFDLFNLPHDPIWIESSFHDGLVRGKQGILILKAQDNGYTVFGIEKTSVGRVFVTSACVFHPSDVVVNDDGFTIGHYQIMYMVSVYKKHNRTDEEIDQNSALAIKMAISAIALLNSRKVSVVNNGADLSKINKARQRRGKLPLKEYKILDILPDVKKRMFHDDGDGKNRLHWRRGHFKVRKTGVFWWSPHLAGNKELGMVEKDYRVCQ